jgi:ribosome-binding factor A
MPSKHQPSGGRHGRIESQMQRVLADLISREVKDPRVGNVTITAVEVAQDLATARIFFVPFAGAHTPEQVLEGLTRAGGFLRGAVGRQLGLRHAPRLTFVFDDTLDKAVHLTQLIDSAVASDADRKPDEP